MRRLVDRFVALTSIFVFAIAPILAHATELPTGGSVAAGSATISSPNSSTLNVNQSTDRAIINWNSFSVGAGGTVNFNQPSAASATLNRVTGDTPSSIAGIINAPGTVLLVNPNGVAITKDGVVNVGSFAASTLDIKNDDFMSGNYRFTGNGASADVSNAGRINVSDGGFAALLGGHVANDGVISARLGKVGLGSGELITLDLAGDGFMSVAVPTSVLGDIKDGQGRALVSNKGKIVADGGVVYLSAATAAGLLRDAVYVPGSIRANSVGTRNGKIVIGGGAGGRVRVAGRVRASGHHGKSAGSVTVTGADVAVSGNVSANGGTGGSVTVAGDQATSVDGSISAKGSNGQGGVVILTADQVTLGSSAKVDVSGLSGGTLLIGGDYQGGANAANDFSITPVKNALTTSIASGATLDASGTDGDGGHIVVWSDDHTTFAGALSVASANGSGGFAEVSGHKLLDFTGTVDLAGTAGAGTLLLDPENITISSGSDSGVTASGGTYTASADSSVLSVATLQAALASGNVIVTTGGAGSAGSQAGDITVANDVTWSSVNSLTLSAYRNIAVNANVTSTGGASVILLADNSGKGTGAVSFGSGNAISTSGAVSIYYDPTGNNATTVNTTSYKTPTDYSGNVTGGGTLTSYMLVNTVYDLQNIQNNLSANYALGRDIDASATSSWNSSAGFVPLGTSTTGFSGSFDGQYHIISGLTIKRATTDNVGLFGYVGGANSTIVRVGLTGVSVTGRNHVGALVGAVYSGSVTDSFATGVVSGSNQIGGLIGQTQGHAGIFTRLYSDVAVIGATSSTDIGGVVGQLSNDLTQAYASGAVSGGGSSGNGGLTGGGSPTATVTYGYYDTSTAGNPVNGGGTGETTAQLQAALPTGFDSNWAIVAGQSYAYLKGFYASGTPQVISGYAFTNSGVTGASGATVSALVDGASVGSAIAGSNGYYNILVASGTIASAGSTLLAYTTGTNGGAHIETATGSTSGVDIWGKTLIAPTTATTYSAASATTLQSQDAALITTAVGSNTTVATLIGGLTSYGYVATGSGFTIDTTPASAGLYAETTATGAGITVNAPITIASGSGLTLDAAGALDVNAAITAKGTAAVKFGYDSSDPTNLSFALGASGFTGSLTYMSSAGAAITASAGGTLMINDASYTLLYDMGSGASGVQGINNGLAGNYALAISLNAASTSGFVALGTDGAGNILNGLHGFSGHFNGLGHTISNLTVDTGTHYYAGLFGVQSGAIAGIGLVGGSTNGYADVGALVGYNYIGSVTNAYATGTVTDVFDAVGGLVGYNQAGVIANVYATGAVSGTSGGGGPGGGLVGRNTGSITNAYATGSVSGVGSYAGGLVGSNDGSNGGTSGTITNVYATGAVTSAGYQVGGLVGSSKKGSITDAYATGAVSGLGNVGGLIGYIDRGTITDTYATGAVTSTDTTTGGGFVGTEAYLNGYPTITDSYWNTETTGLTKATGKATNLSGVTGLTTAQLQGMAASGNIDIATGFANAGWAGGTGGLYPYLTVFYPNGAEAVSGTAFSDAGVTALGSSASSLVKVAVVINGQQVGSAITGANGYYYVMLPAGTVSGSTGVLTYLASGGTTGSGFTDSVSAAVAGLNIYGNTLRMVTADANLSTATGNLATAKGSLSLSALPYSVTGGALTTTAGNVEIDATGSAFTVDRSITAVGTLLVNVANGSLTLASGTLKSSATGNAIVLVDGTTFTNSVGASALSAASGRWLIYSQAEASDNVGGLTGGTIYSSTYAANPPSSISASGNQFVYASGPSTLLISGYVYSDLGATLVGSGVTVNALINGVSVGATTTGSGGEYQFSVASSLLDGSKMLITYTTGATGGVALAENASGVISNLNIYGNALTTATASSNLSTVNANLATAIGGVSGVPSSYANLFVNATGSSFMIDQALNSLSTNLYLNGTSTTQLGATAAINVGSFNLQGGNWVQTGALPGFAATSFTISGGSFLRVAGGDGSSAAPYQVADVYGLQGIGSSTAFLAADWQLANDIDASGTANWNGGAGFVPIGNLTNGFYGSFDGRNYTISGLTINRPSADNVGLFGYATATGSITSVGLSSVAVTGGDNVGGLVGLLEGLASVTNAYVSGSVSGNDSVGGLIGSSDAATVGSSYSNSSVDGNSYVGGLVGTLTHGTINASYAAGSVHGYTKVGGLVGGVGQAFLGVLPKIKDSYAAATVTADTDVAGGLVGENLGSVQRSYASGAVTGRDSIGGLIGWNGSSGIIAASYWDTGTTGVGVAIGLDQNATSQSGNIAGLATALATTQACYTGTGCGGAGGWDFTNIWGIVEGQSHPYFLWQYPASGGTPQVVSGKAYSNFGTTAASGVAVNALVNGTNVGNVLAGANGYYELLVAPGTIAANSQLAVYTTGTTGGLSYRQDVAAGSQTAFNINGTYLTETSAASALSGISSGLLTAIGSNGVSTSYANRSIITSAANFTIDEAITQSGILRISTLGGNISQSAGAALNVNVLQLQVVGNGAPVATLADTNNQFASLGFANLGSGSLNLYDSVSLASGSVTANGGVLIRTAGSLTLNSGAQIASSASGNAVVLDAASNFINNSGSSAISTPGGRWIVYSAAVGGDVFGNLDSGNHAIFNFASDGLPYGDVPAGNRYVFQEQPVLTVTSTGATKTYGDVADISSNYTITGFQGVANAFLTDTAASVGITGAPTLSSTGTAASANVIGGGYTINVVDSGTLGTSGYGGGYVFSNFVSSGKLTVNPATITLAGTKTYDGGTAFSATNFGTNGVISTGINGETLTLSGSGSVASADVSAGTQALTLGSLALANGSGLASNYQIAVAGNTGKITQALLTLTITPDAATKVYGDTLTFAGTEYSQTGLVNGDTISGVTLTSTGTVATANVGHYDIVSSNAVFSSGSASNYNITYVTLTNGLTVTARPLTVTADAQSRAYGDANPTLGYQIGGSGLVNGDTLSGVLATGATTTSNIGDYTITQGTLAASANYSLSYTGANLTVTPRSLTVTADAQSRVYGDANPTLSYQVGGSGLVNGDTLSGVLATGATAASNIGDYAITQGTLAASANYSLSYTGANLTVTPRSLTVTADAQSRVYGDANPTLTYQVGGSGLVNGDTLSGVLATGATTTSNIGDYAITQGTLAASANYSLSYTGANLTVTPRSLTVTADAQSRVYGDANPTLSYQVGGSGLVNGDTLSGVLATGATTTSNIGDYAITQGTLAASSNYSLSYTGANLTVTPRSLTVTADAQSRAYGDANPTLTYQVGGSGLVNSDTLSGVLATVATTASNIGDYAITQGTLAASANYSLSYTGANLTVTPRSLTVTADAQSRVYGDANPTLSYQVGGSGLVNSDTLSGVLATVATTASNIGDYAITQGTLAASANYSLSYTGANLTVTPRSLTVTADAQSRVYGDANPTLTYQVGGSGLVNSDTLSGVLATVATTASNIGDYAITQGTLAASANYSLSYTGANLTVTPRSLTVTADAQSRVYGDANPTLSYQVGGSGLVNSDTLSGVLATVATTTSNIGDYAITQGTLAASANYSLSYTAANLTVTPATITLAGTKTYDGGTAFSATNFGTNGVISTGINGETLTLSGSGSVASADVSAGTQALTLGSLALANGTGLASNYKIAVAGNTGKITQALLTLTITPDAATKVYGDTLTFAGTEYSQTGLVSGDAISGVTLTSTGTVATANVGHYDIVSSNAVFSSGSASNYNITYVTLTNGLTVTARPLTVTADAQSRVYGDANPTLTYQVGGSGLVNSDTLSGVLATVATTTSNIGDYAITQGTLAASANYSLSYTGANLTVTPRSLTVTADAQSRVYGDANPTLTYQVGGSGLVNGDTLSGVLATVATTTSNIGDYAITQGTLAASANYSLSYTGANLTVTPRSLTVTADAQSRVYGDANPTLTYQVGGSGLVNGDTLSGVLATVATTTSNIGDYAITQGTLAASANYSLSYTGANLTVTPRSLTVTADAQSRVYGDANPTLSYQVGGSGLVNSDTLSGVLATVATTASNIGDYAITQGTLAASANYSLSYTGANLTVTPRSLTVTADAQSRVYGDANPTLSYQVGGSGLVNSDTLSGVLATGATTASNIGDYAITQGTLAASANYSLSYTGANLTVTPRSLTVTADAQSRVYGDANPTLSYQVGGSGLVNSDTLSGVLATGATTTSNIGDYAITQGTLAASANYSLSYIGANLTVTPRSLTVTADAQSRVYGDANPTLTYQVGGSGLVNGDTLSGVLATGATTTSNVGDYAITQGTLAASANYSLSYTGANLTVTPRSLTVTADAQSRAYGDANPTLTYQIGGSGLVNGDTLSGVLATGATAASNIGDYAITQGTLAASANYSLSYTGANLTVTPRSLTVTADAQSKIAGDVDPTLTYQVTSGSLFGSDTLAGALSRDPGEGVGSYDILQGTLVASSNYLLSYIGAQLSILPVPTTANGGVGGDSNFAASQYQANTGSGTPPIVNISYQPGPSSSPVITVVQSTASAPTNSNTAATNGSPDVSQNIATGAGPMALFAPISQFDKAQYSSDTLPAYAPEAGQAAILAVVARAGTNSQADPKVDVLWNGNGSSWAQLNGPAANTAKFGDGNGSSRIPAGDNGFAFVNGTTDIAELLKQGPVMLGGVKPADGQGGTPWLLALQMTPDGKGIVADDPITGRQVVLAYDAATKTVGGVTGLFDPKTRQVTALGDTAPDGSGIPAAAWTQLKSFRSTSYFTVTL